MKKEIIVVSLGLCFSWTALNVFADEAKPEAAVTEQALPPTSEAVTDETAHVATDEELQNLPNVGNTTCPVSGEEISDDKAMGGSVHMVYQGKIYNLCCSMCVGDFEKDPQKFVKKIEVMMEAAGAGASEDEGTTPEHQEK